MNVAAVVIPIYKEMPSSAELICLQQCLRTLAAHPIIIIKPHSLNISYYTHLYPSFKIESFDDHFFQGIQGYNKLMLSGTFYERFSAYQYILIHQLDAFVFSDQLLKWCKKNYDYIGAPWIENYDQDWYERWKQTRHAKKARKYNTQDPNEDRLPLKLQFYNQVGNGGFSLRRVSKFNSICAIMKKEIAFYLEESKRSTYFNEDVFWSLEVNRNKRRLRKPNYKTALRFAIEQSPELALQLNNGHLPFGVHDMELYPHFWQPILQQYGWDIQFD